MTDGVPNLRGGASATLAFVLGPLLGAAGFFGALLWQAAKYPDRTEFNSLCNRVEQATQSTLLTEDRLKRVQEDVAGIRTDIKAIREASPGKEHRAR